VKLIRGIKVKLQETIKPNISNKTKNILGVDCVEQEAQLLVWQPIVLPIAVHFVAKRYILQQKVW